MTHRTLFITTDLPRDGGSGGQIASWRALQAHAALGPVDLVAAVPVGCLATSELGAVVDRFELVEVESFHFANARSALTKTFIRAQVGRLPYRVVKFSDDRIRRCVRAWARDRAYTVIHCDFATNWHYTEDLLGSCRVLLHHNIDAQTYATLASTQQPPIRWLLQREARRAGAYELRAIRGAERTLVLSEHDMKWVTERVSPSVAAKVSVWPLPVTNHELITPPRSKRLLVLGSLRSLGRRAGVRWLLSELWPLVREDFPDAALDIVGADPPDDIRAEDGFHGVQVHGYADDLETILLDTQACLIPLFAGGGVRVKILELLARGIPCIATGLGAQGFSHLPGVIVADAVPTWRAGVARALAVDGSLRREAESGRQALLATHTTKRAADEMAAIVGVSLGRPPVGARCA